ncbi:MAG TPA: hypothetical protein VLA99_05015 [Nitrospiraceae bacterium]|nr:hypothetical protein [Nitrospiraceae bacterium]
MARRTTDWFAAPLSLVYIAGTSREAEAAEQALTAQGVDYALSLEEYRNESMLGAIFGSVYKGLFFYVPRVYHRPVCEILEAAGLNDTVALREEERN